ncbi:hypothetical protein HFO06_21800 [Rhizobium leguminosarum]|uniref:hypothetical protein n=1 Tax=Rhizobium leguminosarum TaxID=384 RepID=UPI001C9761AA|nr:hypothetical protein [Rhizobium leguminosarum]MBY5765708.1 hypothetical protein [Rhizobium leguminosarum]
MKAESLSFVKRSRKAAHMSVSRRITALIQRLSEAMKRREGAGKGLNAGFLNVDGV